MHWLSHFLKCSLPLRVSYFWGWSSDFCNCAHTTGLEWKDHCNGDFNAKLGRRKETDEEKIWGFELEEKNDWGNMLLDFLEQQKLYAVYTFYQKKPNWQWTLISPNKEHKYEAGWIMSNKNRMLRNVTAINCVCVPDWEAPFPTNSLKRCTNMVFYKWTDEKTVQDAKTYGKINTKY